MIANRRGQPCRLDRVLVRLGAAAGREAAAAGGGGQPGRGSGGGGGWQLGSMRIIGREVRAVGWRLVYGRSAAARMEAGRPARGLHAEGRRRRRARPLHTSRALPPRVAAQALPGLRHEGRPVRPAHSLCAAAPPLSPPQPHKHAARTPAAQPPGRSPHALPTRLTARSCRHAPRGPPLQVLPSDHFGLLLSLQPVGSAAAAPRGHRLDTPGPGPGPTQAAAEPAPLAALAATLWPEPAAGGAGPGGPGGSPARLAAEAAARRLGVGEGRAGGDKGPAGGGAVRPPGGGLLAPAEIDLTAEDDEEEVL
jgi:hypothetical protein